MAKVLFLQRDGYECFGAMYLSASLKSRGHTTDVLIQSEEGRDFLTQVAQAQPDLVAFSVMSGLHEWTASTAQTVKERITVPVVAGGPHCTFFPEFVEEPGLDAICRGEAEDAFPDFVDALAAGGDGSDVPGFWVKTGAGLVKNDLYPLRDNLDNLPKPDRNLYSTRYPQLSLASGGEILAARGCPFNCTFCYNKLLRTLYKGKGPYIRRHSHVRLLEEIEELRQARKGRLHYLAFVDDLFIQDRLWLEQFLVLYRKKVGLPFMCSLRANLVDEALVDMLAQAGCRMVSFGVESGDATLRNDTLGKKISDAQIETTARLLERCNIRFSTFNMFNLPGENLAMAIKTLRLNQRLGPNNYPWSGLLQPYRGTEVFDQAMCMGLINQGETGAHQFHSPTIRQPDTEALSRFNAYFYWMSRYPRSEKLLMRIMSMRIPALDSISSLLASFHRYVCLFRPLEGWRVVFMAMKAGLKRIKSYF